MKSHEMKLEETKTLQNVFKSNLNKISRGRYKSEQLKRALLYKSREAVIQLFNDYSLIVSEAKYKSIHGEGLKILTPKQMLQKLPITPAQIKAGNTSENLLNEIRQIIFSLYGAKEITKKAYNNTMNSYKQNECYIYEF